MSRAEKEEKEKRGGEPRKSLELTWTPKRGNVITDTNLDIKTKGGGV